MKSKSSFILFLLFSLTFSGYGGPVQSPEDLGLPSNTLPSNSFEASIRGRPHTLEYSPPWQDFPVAARTHAQKALQAAPMEESTELALVGGSSVGLTREELLEISNQYMSLLKETGFPVGLAIPSFLAPDYKRNMLINSDLKENLGAVQPPWCIEMEKHFPDTDRQSITICFRLSTAKLRGHKSTCILLKVDPKRKTLLTIEEDWE